MQVLSSVHRVGEAVLLRGIFIIMVGCISSTIFNGNFLMVLFDSSTLLSKDVTPIIVPTARPPVGPLHPSHCS